MIRRKSRTALATRVKGRNQIHKTASDPDVWQIAHGIKQEVLPLAPFACLRVGHRCLCENPFPHRG